MEVKKESRNSGIELLRIIMTLGVVLLHYNSPLIGGGFKYVETGSVNHYYLFFVENLFICAVNVFVMISGYFLCANQKRSFVKVVELLIQVVVFNYIGYFLICFMDGNVISIKSIVGCLIPKNYYVILYAALYLISPYLNYIIQRLNYIEFRKFVIIIFYVFSVYTILIDYLGRLTGLNLEGMSTVGINGSSAGYTIVNFILVYIVGAYIRYNVKPENNKKVIAVIIFCVVLLYIITIVEFKNDLGPGVVWNYNNPIVIILAGYILIYFKSMKINSKIINELSKGAFSCFLFHTSILPYLNIKQAVASSLILLMLNQVLVITIIYLLSYMIYRIYNVCSKPIIGMIKPICNKIDNICWVDED